MAKGKRIKPDFVPNGKTITSQPDDQLTPVDKGKDFVKTGETY